jgi:excisionase family DNA binding protein
MAQSKITQLYGVDPDEYKESIIKDFREELYNFAATFQPAKTPEYLTRQEVAKLLKISLVTISDWNNKKILNPYRIGTAIRYKHSEIEEALIQINQKQQK